MEICFSAYTFLWTTSFILMSANRFHPPVLTFTKKIKYLIIFISVCNSGYETEACTACPMGKFKAKLGPDPCTDCEDRKTTNYRASIGEYSCGKRNVLLRHLFKFLHNSLFPARILLVLTFNCRNP